MEWNKIEFQVYLIAYLPFFFLGKNTEILLMRFSVGKKKQLPKTAQVYSMQKIKPVDVSVTTGFVTFQLKSMLALTELKKINQDLMPQINI